MKPKNCPRLANAIKQVIHNLHERHGGWWHWGSSECRPDNFGEMVFEIAYKADKYDILNALAIGERHTMASFIRGDIRKEKTTSKAPSLTLLLLIIILIIF